MHTLPLRLIALAILTSLGLNACSSIPSSGPTSAEIQKASSQGKTDSLIQIVDVNEGIAKRLLDERKTNSFAESLGHAQRNSQVLGAGDSVEVSVWEAPPAALFGVSATPTGGTSNARVAVLPEQTIDNDGNINVPFAGKIKAANRSVAEVEQDITNRLKGKANQPQVVVRRSRNATSYVTVVGDVSNSTRMPLTPRGETLLDALASAGGVKQPVDKITIQLTRGQKVETLPLGTIIRDPMQNIPLQAGDVVTALFQPYSFTVLGATGKNAEINFEAQGITLAQALARSGGMDDNRSDAQGLFVFRFEKPDAIDWPNKPVKTALNGKVPVVYRFNLKDPATFFLAQNFTVDNKDILYVSNAPITEVQKFLNIMFSVVYPITTSVNAFK